ncbi:hypothetical protein S2091_1635 [Solimicrobium silvestre]|uniref:Lipid/polyisoprenoid-binding YceI-like domain-containing protein n=2 Tax=Solimicrobium silvestre TaxID=2099400 RepID=A0A2S9H0X2_9BURK|nr:hypothetical protein S2091_1635 [Solimicrobium silvestre]
MTNSFKKIAATSIVAALLVSSLAYASLAALKFDAKNSNVSITIKQMNVPISAKFTKLNAVIDYNPSAPDTAKAGVEIEIASFDLGDPDYNKEVLKKEWFNAAQFPKASFVSTSMKSAANGTLTATGKLTIKGKTVDVSFPVSIKKEGSNQVFDGVLPIKRLTFNIGEGDWKDTSMVADEVVIKFHVVAAQ